MVSTSGNLSCGKMYAVSTFGKTKQDKEMDMSTFKNEKVN